MSKHKRVWTDEQRKAAAERARIRFTKKPSASGERIATDSAGEIPISVAVLDKPERPPEVQAVLDTMDPVRKARLQMIQSRQFQTKEGQEALARHALEKNPPIVTDPLPSRTIGDGVILPPPRIGSREVSVIVRTDGTMVSQYGPCICGKAKREWHRICVKENSNG